MRKNKKPSFYNDLGNIKTMDGKVIKSGLLFRTSALYKLKEKLKNFESEMDLDRVFDLRSPSEVTENPEIVSSHIEYYHLPILDDNDNPSINKKNRAAILKKYCKMEGGAKKVLENIYRKLISSTQALENYRLMIREIIENPDKKTIWHCTQGKDRTGIGSAILLMILGVDQEEIIKDYLNYNKSCRLKNIAIYVAITVLLFSAKMAKNLNYLLTAQRSYIEAAFDEIKEKFGSVDNYIHNALLLTDEDINKIRRTYLVNYD